MKKILVLMSLLISCAAWADAKDVLQKRLAKVDSFYAHFKQTVNTTDYQLIQEKEGEFWLKRPNLFYWTTYEPSSTTFISDGIDIWMYTASPEQLKVMPLEQAVDNRLLLLITDPKSHVWQDYQVKREQNHFTLQPVDKSQQSFKINVLPTGMIADFTIIEKNGQQNIYELSHQTLGGLNNRHFHISVLVDGKSYDIPIKYIDSFTLSGDEEIDPDFN